MIPLLLAAALLAPGHYTADPLAFGCHVQRRVYVLNLDNREHAPVLRHAWAAIRAGQPEILHIDREDAEAHRRASLAGIPKVPGKDLDEYPPAATREGGAGADVKAIDPHANRSAGAIQGARLAPFCDGQAWRYERKPGPKARAARCTEDMACWNWATMGNRVRGVTLTDGSNPVVGACLFRRLDRAHRIDWRATIRLPKGDRWARRHGCGA